MTLATRILAGQRDILLAASLTSMAGIGAGAVVLSAVVTGGEGQPRPGIDAPGRPEVVPTISEPPPRSACATERSALPFDYEPEAGWQVRVGGSRDSYHEHAVDYARELASYRPDGDYLNWGMFRTYREGDELRFDEAGVPMVNVNGDGEYYYHPTTIAQYALTLHGRWARGQASLDGFLAMADALADLQRPDGSLPVTAPFNYYLTGERLEPGWESGLTYGHALNVFARAFDATGEERYREAGDRALEAMTRPATEGGILYNLEPIHRGLSDYVIFEEYPSTPTFFTLNGFMITMLGLYDWWQLDPEQDAGPSAEAREWFECSMATLTTILPLYDVGGMSAYDLGHVLWRAEPNTNPRYHAIHVALLHALGSVTHDSTLLAFEERWRLYVEELRLGPSESQ